MHRLTTRTWIIGLLGLMLVACSGGTTSVSTREQNTNPGGAVQLFEGFYASGPEMSSFTPCEMNELPGPGKGYWLVPNDAFSQLYGNPGGISLGDIMGTYGPSDIFAIYVRFEGILSAEPGKGYGHLGLYAGEIEVTKALEASRVWVGPTEPPEGFVGCGDQ